jgi:hypothetical protein
MAVGRKPRIRPEKVAAVRQVGMSSLRHRGDSAAIRPRARAGPRRPPVPLPLHPVAADPRRARRVQPAPRPKGNRHRQASRAGAQRVDARRSRAGDDDDQGGTPVRRSTRRLRPRPQVPTRPADLIEPTPRGAGVMTRASAPTRTVHRGQLGRLTASGGSRPRNRPSD